MRNVTQHYINGGFVDSHGTEIADSINPATSEVIGHVTLGDEVDTQRAIAAAKAAFVTYSRSTVAERSEYLHQLYDAVRVRVPEMVNQMVEEFGGTRQMNQVLCERASDGFVHAQKALQEIELVEKAPGSSATVRWVPTGVAGLITPWNASSTFICLKMAAALAAGCTTVIKPSEMSGLQTQLLLEALDEAGLPSGLINVVHGRGDVVGSEITRHPDVSKISFTGSTAVGIAIARGGAATMKRVTLELGGKGPNVLLDDAEFEIAIPLALQFAYFNSGQGCMAGTRLLVPRSRLDEAKAALVAAMDATVRVGLPNDAATTVGPMVSKKQYERVEGYIARGIEEGATVLYGGPGHPEGLEGGYFVKPTIFVDVTNDMTIAQEEIFGPVLSVIAYDDEEQAIEIANDTVYGLTAYVSSRDLDRARRVASRIQAGYVTVGVPNEDTEAPFGGFKLSGMGREVGTHGIRSFMETQSIIG